MLGVISTGTLAVHVLAGVVALASGVVALLTRKGRPRHNRAGKTYVLSMAVVVVTAVPLAAWVENWFLLAVAVFTGYLVFGGYRVVARRRARLEGPTPVDWLGNVAMLAVGTGMVGVGLWGSLTGALALGPVLAAFGLIGGLIALREVRGFRLRREQSPWFERHIVFMGAAFIATVTAAVTVNLTMLPELVRWLGPTAVGTPLITYAIRSYRPVFGRPRPEAS